MKIDKHNYEAWFLDYHEGRLSAVQVSVLEEFLRRHPELQQEFDDYVSDTLIADDAISYPDPVELRKSLMDYSPGEERMIALLEGDLAPGESAEFEQEIASSEALSSIFDEFRKTRLMPEESIVFRGASNLKKNTSFRLPGLMPSMAYAAGIIILLGFASLWIFRDSGQASRTETALTRMKYIGASTIPQASIARNLDSRELPLPSVYTPPAPRENLLLARLEPVNSQHVTSYIPLAASPAYLSGRAAPPPPYYLVLPDESYALENSEKTLAGRVISGIFSKISSPFGDRQEDRRQENRNITFWDLAEIGVKSINALGDHNYTLVREYNDKGNVKGVMLVEE